MYQLLVEMVLDGRKFNRRTHWWLTRFILGGVVLQGDRQLPFEVSMEVQLLRRDYSQPPNPTLSAVDGCEAALGQRRL